MGNIGAYFIKFRISNIISILICRGGKCMKVEKSTNQLLFVPFNNDYYVDDNIKNALTKEEFFKNCFIKPEFDSEIQELLALTSEEIKAFEIDLTKDELIKKFERKKREEEAFIDWINSNQNDLYCIKGDAGTGKSTFLHYLNYLYENTEIQWDIVDIQRAVQSISIFGYTIDIPRFNSLYNKGISSLILCIFDLFFIWDSENKLDKVKTYNNIKKIFENYERLSEEYFPNIEIQIFCEKIPQFINSDGDPKIICINIGKYCIDYFSDLYTKYKNKNNVLFKIFIEFYLLFLICQKPNHRHIIAFDNFERFIGTEEIYSGQLTEFVGALRNIQNSISTSYPFIAEYFQMIIFMRNTSVRMFTPLQIADFFPHYIDICEWFQISKIIDKKIKWYTQKNISVEYSNRLNEIINDIGGCDNTFRGLRSKLNMLFNNNKRIIIKFLNQILASTINEQYLDYYDAYWNNDYNIRPSIARFAARTIIYRLILNELRSDGFFKQIISHTGNDDKTSLGYARKILSVLYDFKLQNSDGYMDFVDIIKKLYNHVGNAEHQYFNINNKQKRLTIARILFYMNYYDTRSNNWLQFIDIQYNIPQAGRVRIQGPEELNDLIDKNYHDIKVKITNAGEAYLYYVVYSFEYFSCKSIYSENKNREYGSSDVPPLLCTIPSITEIQEKNVESLTCVKVIKAISSEAIFCIEKMNDDKNSIPFRYNISDPFMLHKNRIINSHTGYLSNFVYCLKAIYEQEIKTNNDFATKFKQIVKVIDVINAKYLSYL